jgi:hypothetical protein
MRALYLGNCVFPKLIRSGVINPVRIGFCVVTEKSGQEKEEEEEEENKEE